MTSHGTQCYITSHEDQLTWHTNVNVRLTHMSSVVQLKFLALFMDSLAREQEDKTGIAKLLTFSKLQSHSTVNHFSCEENSILDWKEFSCMDMDKHGACARKTRKRTTFAWLEASPYPILTH